MINFFSVYTQLLDIQLQSIDKFYIRNTTLLPDTTNLSDHPHIISLWYDDNIALFNWKKY